MDRHIDVTNLWGRYLNIVAERVVCRCCSFYHLNFELVTQQKFETGVVKRATSTYNSFSNNVAERVVRFLLLVFPRLKYAGAVQKEFHRCAGRTCSCICESSSSILNQYAMFLYTGQIQENYNQTNVGLSDGYKDV